MIERGQIIGGAESPVGIGLTGPVRCMVRIKGRAESVILKRVAREYVIAEAFCSLLLKKWGLPVPTPVLVDDDGVLAFASLEVDYPNLSQKMHVDIEEDTPEYDGALRLAVLQAASLPSTPLAAVADEAIGNRDRNLQNILWDGSQEWWIDHERTLGLPSPSPDQNLLCRMAVAAGVGDSLQKSVIPLWTALDRAAPDAVIELLAISDDLESHADFVAERLSTLGQRLTARFPMPDDLLSTHERRDA